ncbi:MAG: hypothetical protein K2I91_00410 [Muribaculaceae bacterium]|nr:hypothetical protein [Muribaculaceae bacterium]
MKSYSSYFEKYLIKDKHIQDILTTVYIYYTTPSELQKFISRLDSIPSHSIDTQLGIALGLSRLGQHDTALRRLPDERSLRNMEDTLRYLAIKSEILEESSRFEEALSVYKLYLSDFENDMNRIFNDEVLFTQEKYRLEMSAQAALQHQKNRKNLFIILTLVTLLILVVVAYLLYIKSSRLSLSEEQQKRLMEQFENERMRLESITIRNEHIDSLINKRLSMLNGIIASEVSGDARYRKDFDKICKQISDEKVKFLSNLTKEIGELCPALIKVAEDAGLSETQLQCLCLLALGVKVKDMSGYLGIGGIYNFTNEIRRKIGLGSDTNLGLYVRGMMRGRG